MRRRARPGTRAWSAGACLPPIADATFDREVALDGAEIAPMVSWGNEPAGRRRRRRPRARSGRRAGRRRGATAMMRALAYMDLRRARRSPTSPSTGSSSAPAPTAASRICARPRRSSPAARCSERVRAWVVPGSGPGQGAGGSGRARPQSSRTRASSGARRAARFASAPTAKSVAPGERCASTSNRNFVGRQGRGARTHLMSPIMAAAAAVTGRVTDVRTIMAGRR